MKHFAKKLALAIALCLTVTTIGVFIAPQDARAEDIVVFEETGTSLEKFKSRVFNGLVDRDATIDVSDLGIIDTDITYLDANGYTQTGSSALVLIVRSHPLFSAICVGYGGFTFTYSEGKIATVEVAYTYNGSLWSEALLSNFKTKYADFISGVNENMTDVQKAAYVHDWVCANTSYSLYADLADYGIAAIANGRAVCGGYSQAYQFLCNQLGLECNYVTGNTSAGSHAWNKVKVDGQWFYVDCTWDRATTGPTTFSHTYFLLNDTEFNQTGNHTSDTSVTGNNPVNTAYYFANKYWSGVFGPLSSEQLAQDPQLTNGSTEHTHVWNDGIVTKEPTCTENGQKTYTCTVEGCGATKTEAIAALGHNFSDWTVEKAETCEGTGSEKRVCTRCDYAEERTTPALGHNFSDWTETPATCTTDGKKTRTCSRCSKTETETLKALGHNMSEWSITAQATCAKEGEETRKCTHSGCTYSESRTIPKTTNHTWDSGKVTKEATCKDAGVKTYTCTVCKATKTEAIKALGHDWKDKTLAATCTTEGKTYQQCSRCSAIQNEKIIPATGHKWDSGRVTKEPTSTTEGVKTYTCTVCGATKTEAIPATGEDPKPDPTPTPTPTPTVETVTMYRLYNRSSGEHFYTLDANEYNTLATYGWVQEGYAWTAPKSSSTPVYRLYNPYNSDHHFTTSLNEYNTLKTIGWTQEGIAWYSDDAKGVAVYRLFNPNETVGTHHYTISQNEYNTLGTIGWIKEGVAWYGCA